MAIAPQPASATTAFASTFLGTMTTGPMGDPCTPLGTLDYFRCATEVVSAGPTVGFAFSSLTCVGAGAHFDEVDGPKAPVLCAISAAGTLTGFCGRATGTGSGTVVLQSVPEDPGRSEVFPFTWQLTWSGTQYTHNQMVLTGTITRDDGGRPGMIFGRFSITPPPDPWGWNSCANGTATHWLVWADWAFEIVDI